MPTVTEVPVLLVMPAEPSYVRIVRLVVSSLAAELDFDVEEIEDLRIAADELVSALIVRADAGEPVHVEFSSGEGILMLRATVASNAAAMLDPLAAQIVSALVATYGIDVSDGTATVRFRSHAPKGGSV